MNSTSIQLEPIQLTPIGVIESPYDEKFSVPRQPNLVAEGKGVLRLIPPYNTADAVRGLSQFSHIWLIFHFHHIPKREWHATVRPPRLGGNERVGVFASRATHRPNPLGLSKVKLESVEVENGEVFLKLGSVDLVNGTPIFDIKPYIAYADSEPNAISGFAQHKPEAKLEVSFSEEAKQAVEFCQNFAKFGIEQPLTFITEIIQQDPRPAYQQGKASERIYGMNLAGYNIRWQVKYAENTKTEYAKVLSILATELSSF
ncbi:tRNA (N6-threonylcarbamoyladenosine(37)-N6)-methyltransferase TrmO [Mannheimia sp. AT1]|uniref:tRNA (N6-threonylcarbamoyladenosine(37)-N6)-methyltransferase TrmO n=1 Tax=Mannheimia cairinae TaxID=3025936 RepID=A0ABT5MN42_9PAST|nr:tRNA (N6-threonylcarbamoyladenosine(37)-N6)-methyltransferase TrmO [Mannheimia cairinae]MDD0823427.1 tRNA (N6-threonylcarbamoyladenosine(37)-N6)-methyltransferase TrmO [Mannheimia cairinae]MDD0826965.1 tRNA (N6-threonylcarbamoyladenosine(37)-N6)-methyltransferase TrmO [Mannheimia cairinae]